MKLIILKNNLVEALSSVDKSIGSNSNLPILKDVKIDAKENNKVVLSSTDLELAIEHKTSAKVIKKGTLVVRFNVLNSVVRNLTSEKINLEKKGSQLVISADNYEASINCDNLDDFPIIPSIQNKKKSIKISKEVLKESLAKAVVATQHSEIRPEINGVYFNHDKHHLAFVGTDSFRLVEKVLKASEIHSNLGETSFIVPLKAVENLLKIINDEGEVEIFTDLTQVVFETDNQLIVSRLVDGTFPDYKAVMPKENQREVFVEREELMNAIKIARVFSGQANDVVFDVNDGKKILEVSSADSALGENHYRIPIKIKGKKGALSLVFNWRYVLDGLRVFNEEEIILGMTEPDKPVVIRGAKEMSTTYVVMPIRG